jgi:hypothetical protein
VLHRGLHNRCLAHALLLKLANRVREPAFRFNPMPCGRQFGLAVVALLVGEPAGLGNIALFTLAMLEGSLHNFRLSEALSFKSAYGVSQSALIFILPLLALSFAALSFLLGHTPSLSELSFLQLPLFEGHLLRNLVAPTLLFRARVGDDLAGCVRLCWQGHQPNRRQHPGNQDSKAEDDEYALAGHNRCCSQFSYQLNDLY